MEYFQFRRDICEIGRRMYDRNYVASNDGNISIRLGPGSMLITPSGVSKGYMRPEDMIVVDFSGKVLEGDKKPSSEMKMHAAIYENRPDVNSVVHAHPVAATAFAVAGIEPSEVTLPELIFSLGTISLAAYGTPTTDVLPKRVVEKIVASDAVLMANHGVVTAGKDLLDAYHKMETVEHFCAITFQAKLLGGGKALPKQEVCKLYQIRKDMYGKEPPVCDSCGACEKFDFSKAGAKGTERGQAAPNAQQRATPKTMTPPPASERERGAEDKELKARIEAMVREYLSGRK